MLSRNPKRTFPHHSSVLGAPLSQWRLDFLLPSQSGPPLCFSNDPSARLASVPQRHQPVCVQPDQRSKLIHSTTNSLTRCAASAIACRFPPSPEPPLQFRRDSISHQSA